MYIILMGLNINGKLSTKSAPFSTSVYFSDCTKGLFQTDLFFYYTR